MLTPFRGRTQVAWERREFLRIGGGLALAGFAVPPLARGGTARARPPAGPLPPSGGARSCILIYLLPMLDQGQSALLEDLEQRGLPGQTLVAVMGEFGRTPKINKDAGRDHWGLCQSVLLAGGGIRGGQVYGSSDRIGAYPASDPVDPVDIHATIYHCMGLGPEHTMYDHLRRPFPISAGRVLAPLV
jgi:hypothetical protein